MLLESLNLYASFLKYYIIKYQPLHQTLVSLLTFTTKYRNLYFYINKIKKLKKSSDNLFTYNSKKKKKHKIQIQKSTRYDKHAYRYCLKSSCNKARQCFYSLYVDTLEI